MQKFAVAFVLFLLLCSILVSVQEVNVASAAEDYALAVELPSGAYIHVYYEGNWSDEEKSVINEQLIIFLPRMCEEFWAIYHNASITIKLKPEGVCHGWGQILYDNSHEEIVGYDGWIEMPPMNMNGVLLGMLHELTHVFQFWIPNYPYVIGYNLHLEAVANAFARALILEHFGWNTSENTDHTLSTYGGQLISPLYYGSASFLRCYTSTPERPILGYHLNKGWTELWHYDSQVFMKINTWIANLQSNTEIELQGILRDVVRTALFEGYADHSYDGYPVDDWLNGFSFFGSLSDMPDGERMVYWSGANTQFVQQTSVQLTATVCMRQAENVVRIPVSSFDINISDGQTREILYSNTSQPASYERVSYYSWGNSWEELPNRNLLRIDLLVHCVDGGDVAITAYLAKERDWYVYDVGDRAIFFLNREGYAEGTGFSNVGPVNDGYLAWKIGNYVEATVTWSEGTYTYVVENIMADPAIPLHQMAIRLYESRTFLSPLAQIIDLDETTQLTAYISPKVSSGKVTIYHSMDKENWAPIANVIPTDGCAIYEYVPSLIGQHYFKASWSGDEIIDPSQSSIVKVNVVENRVPSFISINTSALSSPAGFKVNLSGTLLSESGNGLANEIVNLYMVYNGTKTPITTVATDNAGCYSSSWIPDELGYYTIIAEWDGTPSYFGASSNVTLAFLSSSDQHVFTVESNSTVSEFNYNATNRNLSFTVNGSDGTGGYAKVTVAKNLAADIANLKVYLDSNQLEYSTAQTDDSWIITFNYLHSSHDIVIDLDITVIPESSVSYIVLLFTIVVSLAIIFQKNNE